MKKFLLVSFVLLTVHASFGQNLFSTLKERLSFGIKGGANYSNFTYADFKTKGLSGFHAGGIVNFKLSNNWSIQEEFLYSLQGAKIENNTFGTKQDLKLSYLSVPIMVKYHSNLGIYAELGAQANMLLKDAENTGYDKFADKVDAGAVAGLGYQFRSGALKGLGMGARYYQGFTNVGKFNSSTVQPNFKNSVAQVSLFYIF